MEPSGRFGRIPGVPPGYLRRPLFLLLAAYMLALAALRQEGFFSPPAPSAAGAAPAAGRFLTLRARVASPVREDYWGEKVAAAAREPGLGRVLIYLPHWSRNGLLRPGQLWTFCGRLYPPRAARNPGDFDQRGFLADQGVGWIFKAEDFFRDPEPTPGRWLILDWAQGWRRSLRGSFFRTLPGTQAHVMCGLVLGDKGRLDRGLNAAIQNAGVMHLLVPSGTKVALVLLWVLTLSSWLGAGRPARFLAAAGLGGFYTLTVGADPPYARAYFSALAFYAGFILNRETGIFQTMVLSAWAILLLEPRALFSTGFQMTYLAMAGLCALRPASGALADRPFAARALRTLAATAVVEAMLWPVFAGVFHRAAFLGALANVVLIPYAGVLMAAGFFLWGVWMAAPSSLVLNFTAALTALGVRVFCRLCEAFAALPGAAWALSPMRWYAVLAYYLAAAALAVAWPRRTRAALLILAAAFWAGMNFWDRAAAPAWRILYLWPPESRQVLVLGPGGNAAGLDGSSSAAVVKALRALRVRELNRIVIGPTPQAARAAQALARLFPAARVQKSAKALAWVCASGICAGISRPAFRSGRREFDIMPSLLRERSLEIKTDGDGIKISDGFGQTLYRVRGGLLQ